MKDMTARDILYAYPGRKMNVADARRVVEAWASQWDEDRWGNYKPAKTRRIKFTKRQVRREEKSGSRWRILRSTPMVEAALNLVRKAAETVGDEATLQKIEGAKKKRAHVAEKRAEKAEAAAIDKEVMDMVAKVVSSEMPEEFVALHDTGSASPEFQERYSELVRSLQALRRLGKLPRDQDMFSTFEPPLAPTVMDVTAEWVEPMRDVAYTVTVRAGGANQAIIEIGTTAGEASLGSRVDPVTMSVSSFMDVGREGDAYLSGRIQRSPEGAFGALFLLVSQEKQRGAGSRVLDLWCNLMDAYDAKAWIAEGIGDEGMAFLNAKIRDRRLEKIGGSGANLVFRCLGGPEGRQPELPGLYENPKIVGGVQAYAAANPADIFEFPERPERVTIGSRTYALSDVGVPIVSSFAEGAEAPEEGLGAARIIDAGGNPWRYVWVHEPSTDRLEMYRISDGEWKVIGRPPDYPQTFERLRASGQLNEVTEEEMVEFEQAMRRRNEETLAELKEAWQEEKSDEQSRVDAVIPIFYRDNVAPDIERGWAEIDRGVYPFDFSFREEIAEYEPREDQARMHVVSKTMERAGFNYAEGSKLEDYVVRSLGYASWEEMEDPQAIQWGISDFLYDKVYPTVKRGTRQRRGFEER